ncbi:ketosteroid isomerase-like protein [Granulicella aggregans]|uniref:Ketosteroid isomerase-like protein n=1 Tax=Granulicella aggregans TaxID=474949 RepID=A0A7W8E3I3_9BACT|nr:nuclear transport factor 2 family protein [Granulicella aggregans]MBB5057496.1 ketosteroid isomerase-like protein [Granulicella aggregans]
MSIPADINAHPNLQTTDSMVGMRHLVTVTALLCGLYCHTQSAPAQGRLTGLPPLPRSQQSQKSTTSTYDPLPQNGYKISPLTQPTFTPGIILLLELETKFAASVAAGGGKAFSSWFADDAVSLANGKSPVMGKTAIAAQAQWDPKDYQLTWVAQGAQMGPSNDMGFTWGHYDAAFKDQHGQTVTLSGRYITVWKKGSDTSGPGGGWKVAMESSAEEPPDAGSCCKLPKP